MSSLAAQVEYTYPKLSSLLLLPLRISRVIESGLPEIHLDRLLCTILVMLDERDRYTFSHALRVTRIATLISRDMRLPTSQCRLIRYAAFLHDIGKIAIPDRILRKTDRLTQGEKRKMQNHSLIGYSMLNRLPLLADVAPIVLSHHERWDGLGYPVGLRHDEIPLASRTIAVADTFDAITSNRPYRKGLNMKRGIEEIVRYREEQFDPLVVDHFLNIRHEVSQVILQYPSPT